MENGVFLAILQHYIHGVRVIFEVGVALHGFFHPIRAHRDFTLAAHEVDSLTFLAPVKRMPSAALRVILIPHDA